MSNMKYIQYAEYSGYGIYGRAGTRSIRYNYMDHTIKFKITDVLQQRGQTLYWLSRTTGVSYTTLWRFTKDRALGINFATLEKMCRALECAPGDLMELGTADKGKKQARKVPARAIRRTTSLL